MTAHQSMLPLFFATVLVCSSQLLQAQAQTTEVQCLIKCRLKFKSRRLLNEIQQPLNKNLIGVCSA